ncbi:class I SAM-dependent methyltransferase [Holdemania massiliensis]|uniref:class I SAM-dependent methyltransferase n=1 Tax=Holdemania massiliensis TaxID=1468449 RepID=UPI001F056F71|nr:class I SAM-dependent methyltransferase [Holdemania massiliensis]MCH1940420.1 class I SAM-dependent methyltransferase [Holdemania massiliensis]
MDSEKTLSYYNINAKKFTDGTINVDFSKTQNRFLEMLDSSAAILDFGCGSGRDTKYFLEKGYYVDAIDGSEELCKIASVYTGIEVKCMLFQELDVMEKYDAIWACSSILHLSRMELVDVMGKMARAIKLNGLIYTSFKYGTFEGERNGRYFIDMNEDGIEALIKEVPEIEIVEIWITSDVRPKRGEEKWLNLFLRKK